MTLQKRKFKNDPHSLDKWKLRLLEAAIFVVFVAELLRFVVTTIEKVFH